MVDLTQVDDLLLNWLDYDSTTGIFYWTKDFKFRKVKGLPAGTDNGHGYIRIGFNKTTYPVHKLVWYLHHKVWADTLDHINGNRQDNRLQNLREVSKETNAKNKGLSVRNKSGCNGVCWHSRSNRWISSIGVNGKLVHLGYFDDLQDAINARKKAEKLYGFHPNHGMRQGTYIRRRR